MNQDFLFGLPAGGSIPSGGYLEAASHGECSISPWACAFGILLPMSRIHRLHAADRIFFVTVNLRRSLPALGDAEFASILASFEESRRRLGFLLCGYVLMPDHWHALLWPQYPLTISRLVQDIKYVSSRRLNRQRPKRPFAL